MGFFDFLKRKAAPNPVNNYSGFGSPAVSGIRVTENNAMSLDAYFACVRLISTTLASLPIHVYERTPAGKVKRNDHPIARLLREQPNSEMTAFSFIEALQAQILNRGAAYAEISLDGKTGYAKELYPFAPGIIQPKRKDKTSPIEYHVQGTGLVLNSKYILHIPGLGFDGINSFSPIQLFRMTIGLGLAAEEFGARYFGQGANIGGVVEYPGKLSNEAYERLKNSINENYTGLKNAHSTMIFEEGGKYSKNAIPLEDMQFIESRKFSATQMARIFGVPPHLIGDLEKATFSNIEEQGIEAVKYLFRPWVARWEQALNNKLFPESVRDKFFIKFELDGLLRGNLKARAEAYSIFLQQGIFCVDEVRELEDMNPLPNGAGQVYRFPLNLGEAKKEVKGEENENTNK